MCFLLNGCFESKPVSVASIGNAGSLGGPHFIRDMWVSDIYGGGANFAYGSVQGCCASAGIGIGIPSAIKGEWENGVGGGSSREKWQKRWKPEWGDFDENYDTKWFRIDDVIDTELARQKIETINHYYPNFKTNGVMQVIVNKEQVLLLYKYSCNPNRKHNDCTIRENADPNAGYNLRHIVRQVIQKSLFYMTVREKYQTNHLRTIHLNHRNSRFSIP